MSSKKDKFVEKSIKRHGLKYDYSLVNYLDSTTKVKIICPIHGEFLQTPQAHVRGNGCPLCANKRRGDAFRLSKEEFIERANKIHGFKYFYDKANYVNYSTKVTVTCPIHDDFEQFPSSHLKGYGCPKCNGKHLEVDELKNKLNDIHQGKYDYPMVEIPKSSDKIPIICKKHGLFFQTLSKHLRLQGCPVCAVERRSDTSRLTTEEFIQKAIEVHGIKYDYSLVDYKNSTQKVEIICPKHGKFFQIANDHLNGHGCPLCNESHLERDVRRVLEENKIDFVYQWRLPWNKRYSLDFYLPSKNIGIECQGSQHVEDNVFPNVTLNEVQKRDKYKFESCKENGIGILYYSTLKGFGFVESKDDLLSLI